MVGTPPGCPHLGEVELTRVWVFLKDGDTIRFSARFYASLLPGVKKKLVPRLEHGFVMV